MKKYLIPLTEEEYILIKKLREDALLRKAVIEYFCSMSGTFIDWRYWEIKEEG